MKPHRSRWRSRCVDKDAKEAATNFSAVALPSDRGRRVHVTASIQQTTLKEAKEKKVCISAVIPLFADHSILSLPPSLPLHPLSNMPESLDTIAFENAAVDYQLSQFIDEMLPCGAESTFLFFFSCSSP